MKIKNINTALNKIFSLNLKHVIKLTRYFSKKNLIKFNNTIYNLFAYFVSTNQPRLTNIRFTVLFAENISHTV